MWEDSILRLERELLVVTRDDLKGKTHHPAPRRVTPQSLNSSRGAVASPHNSPTHKKKLQIKGRTTKI